MGVSILSLLSFAFVTYKTHTAIFHNLSLFQDLAVAMKKLGLNPTETEIQDLVRLKFRDKTKFCLN